MTKGDLIALIGFVVWGILFTIIVITLIIGILLPPLYYFIFIAGTFVFFCALFLLQLFLSLKSNQRRAEPKKREGC